MEIVTMKVTIGYIVPNLAEAGNMEEEAKSVEDAIIAGMERAGATVTFCKATPITAD